MFNLPYPVIETGFTQEQLTSIISRAVLIDIIILGVVSVSCNVYRTLLRAVGEKYAPS